MVQTLYKVHKSTLALHATFFRDLFDGPQMAFDAASERYDGVPVMDMQDDPVDVEDFLRAIYLPDHAHRHGQKLSGEPYWSNFPGMYTGILRLAQKYDASKIRKVIVDAIRKEWPSILDDWDERQHRFQKDKSTAHRHRVPVNELHPEPAQTIRLAIEFDIPEILPVAFYDLYRVNEYNANYDGISHRTDLHILTADELCKLTTGRVSLKEYSKIKLRTPLYRVKPTRFCDHVWEDEYVEFEDDDEEIRAKIVRSPCLKVMRTLGQGMTSSEMHVRDIMAEMKRTIEALDTSSLCSVCADKFVEALHARREQLWKALPDLFKIRDLVGQNWGV